LVVVKPKFSLKEFANQYIHNFKSHDLSATSLLNRPGFGGALCSQYVRKLNNFSLVTDFNINLKKFLKKKFKKITTPIFYKNYYLHFNEFLEVFFKKKFFINLKTNLKFTEKTISNLNGIFLKYRSYQSKIGRGFFLMEMLEMLFTSFFLKDVTLLVD